MKRGVGENKRDSRRIKSRIRSEENKQRREGGKYRKR